MSLKSFIIASVLIHILGGIAVYFYYNPIVLDKKPSPVSSEKERELKTDVQENLKQEEPEEDFLKQTEPKAFVKKEKKKRKKEPVKKAFVESKAEPPSDLALQDQIESIEDYKKAELEKEQKEEPNLRDREQGTKENPIDFSLLEQKPGNPPLSYPVFARKLKMQGTNRLLFFVDERGLVERIQLEKSSGHAELDNYVIRVLSQYQFSTHKTGWVRHTQTFVLEGEEKEFLSLRQEENKEPEEEKTEQPLFEEEQPESDNIEFIDLDSLEEPLNPSAESLE